jgi:hypothetical protein
MPHLWKSAKDADSHELLGKVSLKIGETFPHFPQALGVFSLFFEKQKTKSKFLHGFQDGVFF